MKVKANLSMKNNNKTNGASQQSTTVVPAQTVRNNQALAEPAKYASQHNSWSHRNRPGMTQSIELKQTDHSNSLVDCYNAFKTGCMDIDTVSDILSMKVKSEFISMLRSGGDAMDIDTLIYLDGVLFNTVAKLFRIHLQLLSMQGFMDFIDVKSILMSHITTSVNTLDYHFDLKSVNECVENILKVFS